MQIMIKTKFIYRKRLELYFKRIEPMNRNNTFNAFKIASTAIISIVILIRAVQILKIKKIMIS